MGQLLVHEEHFQTSKECTVPHQLQQARKSDLRNVIKKVDRYLYCQNIRTFYENRSFITAFKRADVSTSYISNSSQPNSIYSASVRLFVIIFSHVLQVISSYMLTRRF
jgi:hypothetical protein